jgi:hypothetical protein
MLSHCLRSPRLLYYGTTKTCPFGLFFVKFDAEDRKVLAPLGLLVRSTIFVWKLPSRSFFFHCLQLRVVRTRILDDDTLVGRAISHFEIDDDVFVGWMDSRGSGQPLGPPKSPCSLLRSFQFLDPHTLK